MALIGFLHCCLTAGAFFFFFALAFGDDFITLIQIADASALSVNHPNKDSAIDPLLAFAPDAHNGSPEDGTSLPTMTPMLLVLNGRPADNSIAHNSYRNESGNYHNPSDEINTVPMMMMMNETETSNQLDTGNQTLSHAEKARLYMQDIREHITPKLWGWLVIAGHVAVFIVGLAGNALVCVAVYRNYAMRTVTNYFIVNLAVADFMVILFCLPPTVIWDVTSTWFFGNAMCKTVLYIQTVSVTVSVLTLTFISVDRWYAICYPLRFKSTTRRAQTAIAFIWSAALTLDFPDLVAFETVPYEHDTVDSIFFTQCKSTWDGTIERNLIILRIFVLYFIPLLMMSIFYMQIIRVLWQSGNSANNCRQINFSIISNSGAHSQLCSRKKAAKMLVCVVVMFAICYFPVHLLTLMRLVVRLSNSEFNNAWAMIAHWLCYANSALNPIIYNFMSGKFRKEFRRTMKRAAGARADAVRLEMSSALRKINARKTLVTSRWSRDDTNRSTITSTTTT